MVASLPSMIFWWWRTVRARRYGAPCLKARASQYPWGALWFVGADPGSVFAGSLQQVAVDTRTLLGFLPCGLGPRRTGEVPLVSLFWSVPVSDFARTDFDLGRWKDRVLGLEPRAEELLAQIEDARQLLPASYLDVWMPRFHGPRTAFIGDAAHATRLHWGQGTNLALEDARVLAACVSGCHVLEEGLARFTLARRAHVRYYQRASRGLTPFFPGTFFVAFATARHAHAGRLCRFPPSRRLMLTTLAGVQPRKLFWAPHCRSRRSERVWAGILRNCVSVAACHKEPRSCIAARSSVF